ncbi:S1 RNA-binding domain-containing protein [Labrys monachus]|uniref:Ribosomal protein S1 n=1 Tax=Labrys monachus TaxID=217067 RepID=A0ABU0FQT2_9HYPH|nr:S1 RNA-binding domain-containing protein [Labrys monachus]MDQ0396420.1 ribosomal protein S1 [Labrys monachus]
MISPNPRTDAVEALPQEPAGIEDPPKNDVPIAPGIVTCFHTLEEGQLVGVTVKRVEDYGAFADVDGANGAVGLILIVEISWTRVSHPTAFLSPGQRLQAKIIRISPDRSKVSLSLKALHPDPWQDIDIKYPLQSMVTGRTRSISNYGFFVELEPGVEGLVRFPEMPQPNSAPFVGQHVRVQILALEPMKRRILLGLLPPQQEAELR